MYQVAGSNYDRIGKVMANHPMYEHLICLARDFNSTVTYMAFGHTSGQVVDNVQFE